VRLARSWRCFPREGRPSYGTLATVVLTRVPGRGRPLSPGVPSSLHLNPETSNIFLEMTVLLPPGFCYGSPRTWARGCGTSLPPWTSPSAARTASSRTWPRPDTPSGRKTAAAAYGDSGLFLNRGPAQRLPVAAVARQLPPVRQMISALPLVTRLELQGQLYVWKQATERRHGPKPSQRRGFDLIPCVSAGAQERKADGSHQALRLPLYARQLLLTRYSAWSI